MGGDESDRAPFLLSAAAPWLVQRVQGTPPAMTQLVRVRVSAAAAGVAVTGVLWSAGLLRGAAVTGQAPRRWMRRCSRCSAPGSG